MPKHYMISFAKAVEGRKEELDHWFETQHVPDLLKVPGLVSAQRIAVRQMSPKEGIPAWDYMALYGIDSDDVMSVLKECGTRMASGVMPMSDAMDRSSSLTLIGEPHSFKEAGKEAGAAS